MRANAALAEQNPLPLPLPLFAWQPPCCAGLTAAVVPGGGSKEPVSPMAHSRVTVWKVHFDPCLLPFQDSIPIPLLLLPQECCLCSFDLWYDLWTLSVSVMFGSSDMEQQRGSANQILIRGWGRGEMWPSVSNYSLEHLGWRWNKQPHTCLFVGVLSHKNKHFVLFLAKGRQIEHLIHSS